MGSIDKLLSAIFPSKKEETIDNNKPYLQESLVRSEEFKTAIQQESETLENIKDILLRDFNYFLLMGTEPQYFQTFQAAGANGILIVAPNISGVVKHWSYLLDHLAEGVKRLDYRIQNTALQYFNTETGVKRIERYYLKPAISAVELPVKQLYGNITLEFVVIDEKPKYFKLLASHYSGRNYSPPLAFEELVAELFKASY